MCKSAIFASSLIGVLFIMINQSVAGIHKGKITVPNGEIYFESTGTGESLVLIHAGFSDRRDWQYQFENFGKKYNTIAYDQRGTGNSSVPMTTFWPADDLRALLDHLKIEKAILVGHSVGGTVALDFALQYPTRVTSLVLIASGLNGHSWSEEYSEWYKAIWNVPNPEEMTKKVLSAPFYAISLAKPDIKSEVEAITNESLQKILTWKSFDIRLFFPESVTKLKELKAPTFVVYGDEDSQDIKQIAEVILESLQNVKIAQIKNADHLLNFEKATELNKLILKFLAECELNKSR
jgi:pimeloyl-ACP methyl ester carboxylesterase